MAVVIAVFGFWFFYKSDEAKLNQSLDEIEEILTINPRETSKLGALAKATRIKKYLSDEGVSVTVDDRRVLARTKEQIEQLVMLWVQKSGDGKVQFTKRGHEILKDNTARTKTWVVAHTAMTQTQLENGEWFSVSWEKNKDGHWIIRAVRPLN